MYRFYSIFKSIIQAIVPSITTTSTTAASLVTATTPAGTTTAPPSSSARGIPFNGEAAYSKPAQNNVKGVTAPALPKTN